MSGAEGSRQISQGSDGWIQAHERMNSLQPSHSGPKGWAAWDVGAPVNGHDQVERESPSVGHHGRDEGCLVTEKSRKSLHILVATMTDCHFLRT